MKQYKLGFYGTGSIANDVLPAIQKHSDRILTYGCASRSYNHAKEFADKYGIMCCFKNYSELVSCNAIDVIYVSTPTKFHYEAVKQCLEHGKHVICEKPLTDSFEKAEELFELAKERNLFLMDALWSMFFPITEEYKGALKQIGKIISSSANLGYPSINNSSFILRDLEIYPLIYTLLGNSELKVKNIRVKIQKEGEIETKNLAKFRLGNIKCKIKSTILHRTTYLYRAVGTRGCVFSRKYWFGYPVLLWKYPFKFKVIKKNMLFGYEFEFKELIRCLDIGLIESPKFPHKMTLKALGIQDEFRNKVM